MLFLCRRSCALVCCAHPTPTHPPTYQNPTSVLADAATNSMPARVTVKAVAASASTTSTTAPSVVVGQPKQVDPRASAAAAAAARAAVSLGAPQVQSATVSAAPAAASGGAAAAAVPVLAYEHSWKEKGAQFKRGHWTKDEDRRLLLAIDQFCESKGMGPDKRRVRLALCLVVLCLCGGGSVACPGLSDVTCACAFRCVCFCCCDQALAEEHKHAPELRGAWLAIAGAFHDRTVRVRRSQLGAGVLGGGSECFGSSGLAATCIVPCVLRRATFLCLYSPPVVWY